MLLENYNPVSELRVKETQIERSKYPVIDAHMHWGRIIKRKFDAIPCDVARRVEDYKARGLVGVINLDGLYGDELDRMLEATAPAEGFVHTLSSIDVTRLEEAGFETMVYNELNSAKKKGVKGLKFHKSVGLVHKDSTGAYIAPNDPRLKCIWQTAGELGLTVLFHIADPVAFFKTVDEYNERYDEIAGHPNWCFNKPDMFTFEQLMDMQFDLVKQNPKTNFVLAHVASYAENLAAVSSWLDALPNFNVDIAARISELGRQPFTAREFMTKYADRILYGTDATPSYDDVLYKTTYRFMETNDEYFKYDNSPGQGLQGRWRIYGVALDAEVLQKIYHDNAVRLFNL